MCTGKLVIAYYNNIYLLQLGCYPVAVVLCNACVNILFFPATCLALLLTDVEL